MATNYAAELARRQSPAYIASAVARSKQLLQQYGAWIHKYRGGMPAGMAAAIMYWESNGQPGTVGDQNLGEYGLYQIAAYLPGTLGMPADSRYDPETNVFLGMMEYALDVAKWKAMFPTLVDLGSADSWKLARLSFAIGFGGSTGLAKKAIAAGYATRAGDLYGAIRRYVEANGAGAAGTQSAELVWFRVLTVESQWAIGQQVGGMLESWPGPPTLVPAPPTGGYSIPTQYLPYFSRPQNWFAYAAIGGAAFILWRLL